MSCGVGHRCSSGPVWLWLWRRPAAVALIRPLAWEPPYAMCAALKSKKCCDPFVATKTPVLPSMKVYIVSDFPSLLLMSFLSISGPYWPHPMISSLLLRLFWTVTVPQTCLIFDDPVIPRSTDQVFCGMPLRWVRPRFLSCLDWSYGFGAGRPWGPVPFSSPLPRVPMTNLTHPC